MIRTGIRALCLGLLLTACAEDPGTGPIDVHWDRDVCHRCRMVLSDRLHAAQVRHTEASGRSRVELFDDLGCALIWLDGQAWKGEPGVEIWVNDRTTGEWIDARQAGYVTGDNTPMAYGIGAQRAQSSMDLKGAHDHALEVERRFNTQPPSAPKGR